MPEILSREFLDQQRKTQGSYIYNCQYLNKMTNPELNVFREEHIQYYKEPPDGLIYFMSVDPAISVRKKSDYSGILVVGLDYDSNWWVIEALEEKLEPSDLIDKIFELSDKYQPRS